MDSDWSGGIRLFGADLPLAKQKSNPSDMFPLPDYQAALKSVEKGMWLSGKHGTVTQVVFVARPGSLLASTLDGSLLLLSQNLLDEPNAFANAVAATKGKTQDGAEKKKVTFSKVVHRVTDAISHMRWLDNPDGAPSIVVATSSGQVLLLDTAGGKFSALLSKKVSFSRTTAFSVSDAQIAAAFENDGVHLMDTQLKVHATLKPSKIEDDTVTSIATQDHYIALGMLDQQVQIFDKRKITAPVSVIGSEHMQGGVRAMQWLGEGKLVFGGDDGFVRLFDTSAATPSSLYSFKHADRVTSLSICPDSNNKEVVSGAYDGLLLRHKFD